MTTAEYLRTPETVLPRELAYGELRVADSPTTSHQRAVLQLVLALATEVRSMGELFIAPMDVVLDFEGGLVVQPDLLIVSKERSHIVSDRIYGAPDLVVEVLSPHPRIGRLEERIGWYARYGVRECWLAGLEQKQIVVLSLSDRGITQRIAFEGATAVQSAVLDDASIIPLQIFGW
jgi:Uma2 family endonuclease